MVRRGYRFVAVFALLLTIVAAMHGSCDGVYGGESQVAATAAEVEAVKPSAVEPTPTKAQAQADADASSEPKKRRKKSKKAAVKVEDDDRDVFKPMTSSDLEEGESPAGSIHEAIDDDDLDELEDLLKWKPNLKEKCQKLGETRGFSPIMKAAFMGNAKAMDLLIDYGANVNEVDGLGYTVLMRSVLARSLDCVKLLIDAGAVINYVQKTAVMDLGLSAMKLAELMRETEIIKALREAGADTGESGNAKRRRKAKEQADRFRDIVDDSGLDVDVDALLSMTAEDLKMTNNNNLDVSVHVNGTNTTIKQKDSPKKYAEMLQKESESDATKAESDGEDEGEAKKCSIDSDDESGECAYDPNAAMNVDSFKDEL
jgi:ankyrin repeat protein